MSGPYDQQAASATKTVQAQSTHRSSARADRQRLQRSSSSTSISSASADHGVRGGHQAAAVVTGGYSGSSGHSYGNSTGYDCVPVSGPRRQGRYQRQVIRVGEQCAPHVRQVRRRLPTPEPDTLERVYIQKAAQEVVEEITEVPMTPPPRIKERTVVEPAGPPQVVRRVVRVPARSGGSSGHFAQADQGHLIGAGSFGNVQHSSGTVQCVPSAPAPMPAMPAPMPAMPAMPAPMPAMPAMHAMPAMPAMHAMSAPMATPSFGFQSQGFSSFGGSQSFGSQSFGSQSFGSQHGGASQGFCFQI